MNVEKYKSELDQLKWRGLFREMSVLGTGLDRQVEVNGDKKLVFCSNNYLGLAQHPKIIEAATKGLERWGYGSGGSRLICGNTEAHEHLQGRLARKLGKEACLIFPSGYIANNVLLKTLTQKGDLIAVDKLSHASIIDGGRASDGILRAWPHRQTDRLRRLLRQRRYRHSFIVTDSLFSMDGDKAPLQELVELKQQYEATLILDEAHAFGCLGPNGMGLAEELELLDEVDIIVATFSKALGGAGAFVAGKKEVIDFLINRGRGFIYTTAIPAVNCLAAEAALDVIEKDPRRRDRLLKNAEYTHKCCAERNLNVGQSDSYIVPFMVGSSEKAVLLANTLWEHGYMAPAIRPPTVPPGSSRIRISLMSEHKRDDIYKLCQLVSKAVKVMGQY